MTTSRIEAIRAVKDAVERVGAAAEHARRHMEAANEALQVRDETILQLASEQGVTAAARLAGVSVSRVKQLRHDAQLANRGPA